MTSTAVNASIGALAFKVGSVPLTLSTAGGALIAGLVRGWLRSVHPTFGRIPPATVWFMDLVGLNVFIAVAGISAGLGFVAGLQQLGIGLFLWGILATAIPLVLGMLSGKYVFRFHSAVLLGAYAGARATTAALGMLCEAAKSQVLALGYTDQLRGGEHAADHLGHGHRDAPDVTARHAPTPRLAAPGLRFPACGGNHRTAGKGTQETSHGRR